MRWLVYDGASFADRPIGYHADVSTLDGGLLAGLDENDEIEVIYKTWTSAAREDD